MEHVRQQLAHKQHRSLRSRFSDLLTGGPWSCGTVLFFFGLICHWLGAKPAWLEAYRNHPKVLRMWEKGECGGGGMVVYENHCGVTSVSHHFFLSGVSSAVCNLQQNPSQRAVVSSLVPTLMRSSGTMFLITNPNVTDPNVGSIEERWLFPKDWNPESEWEHVKLELVTSTCVPSWLCEDIYDICIG